MNILFTLCGRAGSKGFKNKNLKIFLGVPLIYYSIAAIALFSESESGKNNKIDLVLNTDSNELLALVSQQQMFSFSNIKRDITLSGDLAPKVAVIRDCLNQMEEINQIKYDIVVDLDITSPLRTVEDIKKAIEKKSERSDVDVVYSVANSRRNPYFNMVKQENDFFCKAIPSEYTARQQAPVFYDMNASIYVYSVEALRYKNANVFFNNKCDAIVMKDTGILDIDSEEDFELLQVVANYLFNSEKKFGVLLEKIKNNFLSM